MKRKVNFTKAPLAETSGGSTKPAYKGSTHFGAANLNSTSLTGRASLLHSEGFPFDSEVEYQDYGLVVAIRKTLRNSGFKSQPIHHIKL